MSCRLVNTILVLSQSSIPDISFSDLNDKDVERSPRLACQSFSGVSNVLEGVKLDIS